MFIGHYAISLALKKVEPQASLGYLFLLVQLVDIVFFSCVLTGIERITIIENYTAATNFRLDYMPYTHSLFAVLLWSGFIYVLFYFFPLQTVKNKYIAFIMALAVFSHWVLDLIVHTPDLPIWIDGASIKVGFGLWQSATGTYIVEAVLLLVGFRLYMSSTTAICSTGKFGMVVLILVLLLMNGLNIFGPLLSESKVYLSISSLSVYFSFAVAAFWLDTKRN